MTQDIRNIAIIAHVDHGKTTLVDKMLRQSGTFRENQQVDERVMDSGDLEKEKGITISSKNTAVLWKGTKINIVDTPGHADFGGEVERILKMVNGVILLVDAAEGPLPQTKFVLRKSLALGYQPIVLINKIDRQDARPDAVLNMVFDLFVSLDASDEQLDFPVLYAAAIDGYAKTELEDENVDMAPLFDKIVDHIPPPKQITDAPFKMLVSSVDWNDYVGRIAIGRVEQGTIKTNQEIILMDRKGNQKIKAKATKLYTFNGLNREPVDEAQAGDIFAMAGYDAVEIGDTLTHVSDPTPIEYYDIDQPTMAMYFRVNNSPFAGLEGDYVTSNQIKDRLNKEIRTNVSIRVEQTDNPDIFRVAGRGELQLAILIETMRREGYEFAVSRPEVLYREIDGQTHEPFEEVVIDVHADYSNKVIDNLQKRKGIMTSMVQEGENHRVEFKVPSRGLIGFRGEMLTETRGTGIMHQQFDSYEPYAGDIPGRTRGALISLEKGDVTPYALEGLQDRGQFIVEPGDPVYTGQVVGINNRADDLVVNVVKKKNLTNHRATQTADSVKISQAKKMSLEQCIEFIDNDELLEVTPKSLRIRKTYLDHNERKRAEKKKELV
ncbi:translational GTPase TypA [Rhodohalobacter barkolensis]|uniref:Large ribosomal subunit assembly factor BipA n=1 Tax=Rhodohalobacter barkolensis TaxID=2053187 RepID=A0A2N0VIS2_9BACT|nr:translational GTPase TypA [Rhodohalobacter barkolensis]PKD44091.1 translational GTPase TypA [Rhodohalobacter barkolensis]